MIGAPGSGRSRLQDLLLAYDEARNVTSWLADSDLGQSLPGWNSRVERLATGDDTCTGMLLDAADVVGGRAAEFRKSGTHTWTPDLGVPLLTITIPHTRQALGGHAAVRAAEKIVRLGRRTGVVLRLEVDDLTLTNFGGSGWLREAVLDHANVIALRTTSRHRDPRLPDIPRCFPTSGESTFGVGFTSGAFPRHGLMRVLSITLDQVRG